LISVFLGYGEGMLGEILIPAETVSLLRNGLRSQIAVEAQQIADAEARPDTDAHPERYEDPLRCIDALRALMTEIGWSAGAQDNLHLDLQLHGWALTAALADEVGSHADLLRDNDRDPTLRQTVRHNIRSMTVLALAVLLRMQAQILRPTRPQTRGSGEAYAGFL
jgi:hypothetical protein